MVTESQSKIRPVYVYVSVYLLYSYVYIFTLEEAEQKNEQTFTLRQKVKEKAWDLSSRVFVGIPDKKKKQH